MGLSFGRKIVIVRVTVSIVVRYVFKSKIHVSLMYKRKLTAYRNSISCVLSPLVVSQSGVESSVSMSSIPCMSAS